MIRHYLRPVLGPAWRALKRTRFWHILLRVLAAINAVYVAVRVRAIVGKQPWEFVPCALCGGTNSVLHKWHNGLKVMRCPVDGLVFVSPRPTQLARLYDRRYYNGGMPGVYRDYNASSSNSYSRDEWSGRLEKAEASLGRVGTLLDVGCATGVFLALARDRGWKVSGIELSEWAADYARKTYGLEVMQGAVPDERIPTASYDLVTLWDCIEHLPDPGAVLTAIHRVLKPGGRFMLSTGAIPHKDPDRVSRWYYPPWHLYYFSRETISAILERYGFTVCEYTEQADHIESSLMVVLARPHGGPG